MSKSELACVYASLILADDDVDITGDKISTILKAANIKFVESYLPGLFASSLSGRNLKDMLMNMGSAAPAASGPSTEAPSSAAAASDDKSKEKKEESKPEPESDSDESMGFDLFG